MSRSDTGPAKPTFDVSPADGSIGGLLGFVGGVEYGNTQASGVGRVFTRLVEQARTPKTFVIQNWSKEAWTRGCPVAIAGPGVLTEYGPALTAPVGRIHWAGTETASYWHGYMDGAVRSGERAAKEVLSAR